SRNEGTPSQSEVPNAGAQRFWLLFWRLKKVTRRKGETLRSRYRSNGYSLNPNPKLQTPKTKKPAEITLSGFPVSAAKEDQKSSNCHTS
ncbi:hypothetical protein, partial [Pseudomonas sp. SDO52101_S400]